jgi:hypothetical protein
MGLELDNTSGTVIIRVSVALNTCRSGRKTWDEGPIIQS